MDRFMHMNSLRIKAIILFFYTGSLVFGQTNNNKDCKADILFRTNDSLSVIYINGKPAGSGNNLIMNLPKGNYSIEIKNNKFKWGARIIHDTLVINNCDTSINLSYFFDINQKVHINTTPSNAEVFYKDSLLGYTPLELASDLSRIDIKKNMYESKEINIDRTTKKIDLNLNYLGRVKQTSFSRTNLFKVLVGSAVALGATAAYFKLKADDNFDKYNSTNDKKYMDNTDRYDLISGVAFGVLQINFGVLIYYFLND